jgi:hypothetical protein
MRGKVRNVSEGGLCVAWDRAPNSSSILRCRIFVDGAAAAIPTLAQVRWMRQGDGDSVAGMAFLLQ